jgi:hypothetical protein
VTTMVSDHRALTLPVAVGAVTSIATLTAYGLLVPADIKLIRLDYDGLDQLQPDLFAGLVFVAIVAASFIAGTVVGVRLIEKAWRWPFTMPARPELRVGSGVVLLGAAITLMSVWMPNGIANHLTLPGGFGAGFGAVVKSPAGAALEGVLLVASGSWLYVLWRLFVRNPPPYLVSGEHPYAARAFRLSHRWTADAFEIERRDYDPDGAAWAELVSAATSNGYELALDDRALGRPWLFVRTARDIARR